MKLEKISLQKCKAILQSDGSVYTDEEVLLYFKRFRTEFG